VLIQLVSAMPTLQPSVVVSKFHYIASKTVLCLEKVFWARVTAPKASPALKEVEAPSSSQKNLLVALCAA
jgi:hypothetical protein